MRHVLLDEWSRRQSAIHRRDARIKLIALLVYLVTVTTSARLSFAFAGYALLLAAACGVARLPVTGVLARAGAVLPFSAAFALFSLVAGEAGRAALLLAKSYLAAGGTVLLIATTPLPELMNAAQRLGAPPFLILVIQFLFRYLFVVAEEAKDMLAAARCRAPRLRGRAGFRAAAGALAVLFAKSHQRAEGIHLAMLARGFRGTFPRLAGGRLEAADGLFLVLACALPVGLRLAVR